MVYRKRKFTKKPNLTKLIKKVMASKVEVKAETVLANTNADNNGTLIRLLQSTVSGTAHDQRIGNRTNLLSINLRMLNSLADIGYNNCRYAIIQCRSAPASVSSIFQTTSYAMFGGVYADWDYDIVKKVYLDRNITLNQQVVGNALVPTSVSKFRKHYTKIKLDLHYDTAAANSLQEQLFLVIVSDSVLPPHPGFAFVVRSRYTDS